MPAWIHERAEHILAKNPKMPKSMAFALATQQSHAKGKTPKGYGTRTGKIVAKAKYDQPKKEYTGTANPQNLKTPKLSDKPKTRWTGKRLVKAGVAGGLAMAEDKKPSDFDPKQLKAGIEVEKEHGNDPIWARQIAMDHLTEIPDYYTRLKKMEAEEKRGEGTQAKIREFLLKHPSPSDKQVHAFAQSLSINEHRLEEIIYSMLAKELKKTARAAFADEVMKLSYAVSQYSGPLSYGSFRQASYIPPFRSPQLKTAGPPGQKKTAAWGKGHTLAALTAAGFGGGMLLRQAVRQREKKKKKVSMVRDRLKEAEALSPATRLAQSQQVGQPRLSAPPGPSIAQVAKPKGFGQVLPGAGKNFI